MTLNEFQEKALLLNIEHANILPLNYFDLVLGFRQLEHQYENHTSEAELMDSIGRTLFDLANISKTLGWDLDSVAYNYLLNRSDTNRDDNETDTD